MRVQLIHYLGDIFVVLSQINVLYAIVYRFFPAGNVSRIKASYNPSQHHRTISVWNHAMQRQRKSTSLCTCAHCHTVTLSHCYIVTMLHCYTATLLYMYFLLHCTTFSSPRVSNMQAEVVTSSPFIQEITKVRVTSSVFSSGHWSHQGHIGHIHNIQVKGQQVQCSSRAAGGVWDYIV